MSILSFLGLASSAAAEPLAVGAPAPQLTALDQDGRNVDFATVYGKGATLVYFYPKADTPGCTKQACSLRDDWKPLQEAGVQVLGVSSDQPEAQKRFQEKYMLPFTLIADADAKVAAAFGVPTMLGMAKRQSFLIKDGKIAWTMTKASTDTHSKDVLAAFQGLAAK